MWMVEQGHQGWTPESNAVSETLGYKNEEPSFITYQWETIGIIYDVQLYNSYPWTATTQMSINSKTDKYIVV